MAVALVATVESVRTVTTDPGTFSYAGGTPEGIVVAVVHGVTATRHAQTVTYGGVALALIVEAADTATEPGNASLWFLGAGIPSGTQTVSVDLDSATGDDIHFVVWELSGGADLEVIDSDELNNNAANPTVTLQSGGRTKISLCAMYGGGAAPGGTLATGNTIGHTHDLGAFYSQTCSETTVDNANHTTGWSTLGTDDLALVAIAVSEKEPITGTLAVTNANDTLAASGTVTPPAFTGTLATTNANDSLAASGTVTPPAFTGTVAYTNTTDTLAASGTVTSPPITGTLAYTNANDTVVASGTSVPPPITGTIATTNAADTLTASGTAAPPAITGTLSYTNHADTLVASGTIEGGEEGDGGELCIGLGPLVGGPLPSPFPSARGFG